MPAPATIDDFLDVVRKSNQIDSGRLDAYVDQRRSSDTLPPEPQRLAALMVREGLLTAFQAEQLLQGRYRGFSLGGYRVLERLGSGGTGTVYLAEHEVMKRKVALKVLPLAVAEDQATLERFRREAQAAAALDHPNIVRAYDFRQENGLNFLVLEYVSGPSLQEVIQQQGALPVDIACEYVRQAALGLAAAHASGIVHRDVKPANLLVDGGGVVKVLDLGLARFAPDGQESLTKKFDENTVMGTADYLAPEQALNLHDVDHRADVYSLGATFYALLTGEAPFQQGTVTQKLLWHQMRDPRPVGEVRADVPDAVAAVLATMMDKSPDARYQSAEEVAQALEPWCAAAPAPQQAVPACRPAPAGKTAAHTRKVPTGDTSRKFKDARPKTGRLTGEPPAGRPGHEEEPAEPPRRRRAPNVKRSSSTMAGTLILGGVIGGVVLLVGIVVAVVIWGPQASVQSSKADPDAERPFRPTLKPAPPAPPPPPPFQLAQRVGEVLVLPSTGVVLHRVAFGPDGETVYSASADGVVRRWHLPTKSVTAELRGHAGEVTCVRAAVRSPRVLSAGADGTARLVDVNQQREVRKYASTANRRVWAAVFSPDEKRVLIGGEDRLLRLFEAGTGKHLRTMKGHTAAVNDVAYRPKGPRQALSASWDRTVRVWNLDNGKELRVLEGHTDRCNTVTYLPDGVRALSGGNEGAVLLWDVEKGQVLHRFEAHQRPVWYVAVSPDGRRALSAGADNVIQLLDLQRQRVQHTYRGHARGVSGVAFAPGGRHFASSSHDGTVRLWGLP